MATARNYAIVHRMYTGLAVAYGMEKAAILSQVSRMGEKDGHFYPILRTLRQLTKAMPYLSRNALGKHIHELVRNGALIRREVSPQRYEYSVNYALVHAATGVRIGSKHERIQTFSPHIAAVVGLREAVVLAHILYWQAHGKHRTMAGEKAIYRAFASDNQRDTWASMLPYISTSTIQRCLGKLASIGLVIIGHPDWSTRRTLWYAVNRGVLSELFHYLGAGDIDVNEYKIQRVPSACKLSPALAARFEERLQVAQANGFRRPGVDEAVEALEPKARKLVRPILDAVRAVRAVRRDDAVRLLDILRRYRLDDVVRALRVALARPARRFWRQLLGLLGPYRPTAIPALR